MKNLVSLNPSYLKHWAALQESVKEIDQMLFAEGEKKMYRNSSTVYLEKDPDTHQYFFNVVINIRGIKTDHNFYQRQGWFANAKSAAIFIMGCMEELADVDFLAEKE